jgi:hypothetical protein
MITVFPFIDSTKLILWDFVTQWYAPGRGSDQFAYGEEPIDLH